MTENSHAAINSMKKLHPLEMDCVLLDLIRAKHIKFDKITASYVKSLEEDKSKMWSLLGHLSTALAALSHGKSKLHKHARRILWLHQIMKGLEFGKELEEEFKNEKVMEHESRSVLQQLKS